MDVSKSMIIAFPEAFVPSNLERSPLHTTLFTVATRFELTAILLNSFGHTVLKLRDVCQVVGEGKTKKN